MNKIFLPLLLLFGGLSPAHAFRLTPMAVHFAPEGPKSTQVLTLENNASEKVPVQIEATTRSMDGAGKESRGKTDQFIIYPEQVVLLPNEKRNVRVTWNGGAKFDSEKAFRIIASQLPLEFHERNAKAPKSGASLNFLVQYVASAYVTPAGARARIKVLSARLLKPRELEIEIANQGTAHRLLKPKKLIVKSGEKTLLEMEKVKELDSENLLAGATRRFVIHLSKPLMAKNIAVDLSLEELQD